MTSSWAGLAPADLDRALDERLALADRELDAAVAAAGDAGQVLSHLDRAARHALAGHGRSATLWAVHPDAAVREASQAATVRYEAWRSRAFARRDLFAVLAAIDDTTLQAPDARHCSLWRSSQRVNGAHLDDAGRAELEWLLGRASELAVVVSAAFTDDLPYLEVRPEALDGLAAELIARFEPGAPGTVRVPVDYQTRDAFLAHVRDRHLRERFWRTFQDRGLGSLEQMRELFDTRRQAARLSGFESWAALRTATSSVRSVDAAEAILDGMAGPSRSAAAAFIEACETVLADELRGDAFQPWDQFAGIDRLTRSIGTDRDAVRPYLTVDGVIEGLIRLAREVFGIRIEERPGGMGWHEDVRTLALIDDATGEQLGTCLWDPWDRLGKMAGTVGFMDLLEADAPTPGSDGPFPPAVTMLVTMFPRPADGSPAHIGVGDAEVLFHEFGHVLDFTIGSRRSIELGDGWWGTDWVEGPSFSIGFWSRAPEVIATYARHPETGEPVPAALVEGLALAQAIEDVPYVAKYLQLARVDLAVHGRDPVDLDDAWRQAAAQTLFPDPLNAFRPYAMSMIAGGYDAALYGVVYSLEIRDELLAAFARGGWLSPVTGRAYIREVLVPGAFVPPVERLAAFLGHRPTSGPLVERLEAAIGAVRTAAPAT
jgi:thimet oligopeptidase